MGKPAYAFEGPKLGFRISYLSGFGFRWMEGQPVRWCKSKNSTKGRLIP